MIESPTILTPASSQAEDARQAGAELLNGNGFYRFKIGDFQATVISDGYMQIPVGQIFAMNASEAELAPVLKANFMQPVIQVTNNILVVDTGRERILVDTGFGEKLGPSFGSFPGLETNLRRAGITPERIDLVVMSHCHLDHIGGLVTKSGALAFPKAQFVFVDTEWNYWTGSRYESEVNRRCLGHRRRRGLLPDRKSAQCRRRSAELFPIGYRLQPNAGVGDVNPCPDRGDACAGKHRPKRTSQGRARSGDVPAL